MRITKAMMRAALLKAAQAEANGRTWSEVLYRQPGGSQAYEKGMSPFCVLTPNDRMSGGYEPGHERVMWLCMAAASL